MGPVERWKRKRNPLFRALVEKYKNKIVKTKWQFGIIWFDEEDTDNSDMKAFNWVWEQRDSKGYHADLSWYDNTIEIDNVGGWRSKPRRTKST